MSYDVDIHKRDIDPYVETPGGGRIWLDGDVREVRDHGTDTLTYDSDDAEEHGSPVAWATEVISKTDAYEPSQVPVPAEAPAHLWLSGSYADPYSTMQTETSVRLSGDWTPAERADVFRAVYRRVFPNAT